MDQKKYWQEMKYFAAECENILFNGTQQHSLLTVPLYICSRQLLFVIHFLHPFRESWSGFAWMLEERCLGLSIKILMETSNRVKKNKETLSRFEKIKEKDVSDHLEAKK